MSLRRTLWTGLSSYGQLASVSITVLLSVPLALRYLGNEEFGLWSFASQAVGYLMLIDLGVSGSISRLMVEPLNSGNQEEIDRWFSLTLKVLLVQAALLLAVGLPTVGFIVHWFDIPVALQKDAARLLTLLILINAVGHPFRICAGILFAQNRAYAVNIGQIVCTWINLAAFAIFLWLGFRSVSYALANAAGTALQAILAIALLLRGPHRFHLAKVKLFSVESRELFRFSSGLFFVGVAVQIVMVSQSLILTKFAGLAAVASFTVSTRAGMLLMQLLWRPIDSFAPRWQELYVKGEHARLAQEFVSLARLTLGITGTTIVFLLAFNELFVRWWAKPELYLGSTFDLLLGAYLLVNTINHCLALPFVLAKQTGRLAAIAGLEAVINLTATVWAVRHYGPVGLLAASIATTAITSLFWVARFGPHHLQLTFRQVAAGCRPMTPVLATLAAAGTLVLSLSPEWGRWSNLACCGAAFGLLVHGSLRDLQHVAKLMSRQTAP